MTFYSSKVIFVEEFNGDIFITLQFLTLGKGVLFFLLIFEHCTYKRMLKNLFVSLAICEAWTAYNKTFFLVVASLETSVANFAEYLSAAKAIFMLSVFCSVHTMLRICFHINFWQNNKSAIVFFFQALKNLDFFRPWKTMWKMFQQFRLPHV